MSLSWWIGHRFSRAKQRNQFVSFISISSTLGIAFGVAVIIIGLSAMNGFEHELRDRVLAVMPHAQLETVDEPMSHWQALAEQCQQHPQVIASAPYIHFTALVENHGQFKAVEVKGVDRLREANVSDLPQYVTGASTASGSKAQASAWSQLAANQQQIILGKGIADTLGVKLGQQISLLVSPAHTDYRLPKPKRIRLTVIGILSLSGQIDHQLALIPLADAQQILGLGQQVHGISLKLQDLFQAQAVVGELGGQIKTYMYLKTWRDRFGFLYRDIQLVRTIMYLVMFLVICVASFNIVSTLMMAVKDRAAEIAILRTMGASDQLIRGIFVWYGVLSGVLGSVLGSLIGIAIALNLTPIIQQIETLIGQPLLSGDIYFINFLPSQIHSADVLLVSGTAIALSLAATFLPARKACQLDPAVVLSSK